MTARSPSARGDRLVYPYPFINPSEPAGVVGVVLYIVGFASFIVGRHFLPLHTRDGLVTWPTSRYPAR